MDTVCFDKTGTLTQNRMSVVSIALGTALHEAGGAVALPEAGLQVAMLCHSVERVAQAGTVLLPPLRRLLGTTALGPAELLVVLATAALPLLVREGLKERAAARASV